MVMSVSADEVLTQIVFWSTAFIVLFLSGRFIYRASDRAAQEVTEERQRLRQEVLGEAPQPRLMSTSGRST